MLQHRCIKLSKLWLARYLIAYFFLINANRSKGESNEEGKSENGPETTSPLLRFVLFFFQYLTIVCRFC